MEWLSQKLELSRGEKNFNVRPMEGLRGFAVFLVFLVHFASLVKPWISQKSELFFLLNSLHSLGNAGVDLFFVLSGYLIYGSLISRRQLFLLFMSRRVERIYPVFSVVFACYVVLSFVLPAERKIPEFPVDGFIYLAQNFFLLPGIFPIEPMITVAWSLSYELFYYLVTPFVILLFQLRERSVVWRSTFFLCFGLAIAVYFGFYGGPVRLVMFISGILLYEAMKSSFSFPYGSWIGLIALMIGLTTMLLPLYGNKGFALKIVILSGAFFTLCLACFKDPASWLSRFFAWTPLRWLGNMSYSYYLLHGITLKALFFIFTIVVPPSANYGTWFFWLLLLPTFALTLVPAFAIFLWVERPFSLMPNQKSRIALRISFKTRLTEQPPRK